MRRRMTDPLKTSVRTRAEWCALGNQIEILAGQALEVFDRGLRQLSFPLILRHSVLLLNQMALAFRKD
jgi:hypothetical protein